MPRETRASRDVALGRRLALARTAIAPRMSQKDFAGAATIKNSTYSQWESGENRPSLEYMVDLCTRYPGLTLDWVYLGKKDGMPSWLSNAITVLEQAEERQAEAEKAALTQMKVVQPRGQRRTA